MEAETQLFRDNATEDECFGQKMERVCQNIQPDESTTYRHKILQRMNLSDHDALMTGTKESFMVFFTWLCDTSKIQKKTTLLGYKRAFKMMYEKSVGMALSPEIYEALHLVREAHNGPNKTN